MLTILLTSLVIACYCCYYMLLLHQSLGGDVHIDGTAVVSYAQYVSY